MTKDEAIQKLKHLYDDVDVIGDKLFRVINNSKWQLCRLENGRLEKRIEYSNHRMGWEEIG